MTLIIGVLGATIILVLFIVEQSHKISNDSLFYDVGNFVGSVLLVVYAYLLSSVPFFILNLVWAAFSLKDIFVDFKKK